MGRIVKGQWIEDDADLIRNGSFARLKSGYAEEISSSVIAAITKEPGRFRLIASLSCPWSHRALIAHRFKSLETLVPVQFASGQRTKGYPVNDNREWRLPGTTRDITYVYEIYITSDDTYTGRASVPVLWDSVKLQVVSNDSLEIMKAFDRVESCNSHDEITLYPEDIRHEIDELNNQIFAGLANSVYRAGLARAQRHYDDAVADVFETLDRLETRLARGRFLFGRLLTLSDLVLFPVLIRFDIVYNTLFRCTRHRLVDYPMIWAYACDLYAWETFARDVDFAAIQTGYFHNDGDHNPYGIISERPDSNWHAPHSRGGFGAPLVGLRNGGAHEFEPTTLFPNEMKESSK
ncbi:MAG: glutathione S-transferase C-terminal domain-containing protein [Paracoccaceae bacterium]